MTEQNNNIPADFIDQVKQGLEHLYDFPFLQRQALARLLAGGIPTDEPIGHLLRRELVAAIETMNPGNSVSVRSGVARLFNLMHLHYVGGMTIQETSLELGISLRQAYRDLRRGQESVSEILWLKCNSVLSTDHDPAENTNIQTEVARLDVEAKLIDISALLQTSMKAVEKLAERQHIQFELLSLDTPIFVHTNVVVAQQILIGLLSQTVQQLDYQTLSIQIRQHVRGIQLGIQHESASIALYYNAIISGLLKEVGWHLSQDALQVTLTMSQQGTTILIVDDNEGLLNLFERFLTGHAYQIAYANNGLDGLRMAQDIQPAVIILDLMMPGMDGWELLQRLRMLSSTATIPVIICSVINDPELAYSLGAVRFISKPIGKETLLNTLQELGI